MSALTAALCCLLLAMLKAADAPWATPNILLILADDVGYSDLGCYGSEIQPAEGRSLCAAMRGEADVERPFFFEHEGNRAVRIGKWKLVSLAGRPWELYDLEADRVELHDLAAQQPDRVAQLAKQWAAWAARCHVEERRPEPRRKTAALQNTVD